MNSIIFTHVATPANDGVLLDVALDRLDAWLDDEIGSLEDLLDITDHEDAIDDISVLRGLHLDAASSRADIRRLLEDAQGALGRLLERVRTIPFDGPLTGQVSSDFDAWLRWTGARLQDLLTTLRHALAA